MNIDKKDAAITSLVITLLIYALLAIITTSEPEMLERLAGVLGDKPLGLSLRAYILGFTALLCFPLLFFFWHIYITIRYAKGKRNKTIHVGNIGALISLVLYLQFLLRNDNEPPAIKRSKIYAFLGIIYLIGIVVWWIIWTEKHGI